MQFIFFQSLRFFKIFYLDKKAFFSLEKNPLLWPLKALLLMLSLYIFASTRGLFYTANIPFFVNSTIYIFTIFYILFLVLNIDKFNFIIKLIPLALYIFSIILDHSIIFFLNKIFINNVESLFKTFSFLFKSDAWTQIFNTPKEALVWMKIIIQSFLKFWIILFFLIIFCLINWVNIVSNFYQLMQRKKTIYFTFFLFSLLFIRIFYIPDFFKNFFSYIPIFKGNISLNQLIIENSINFSSSFNKIIFYSGIIFFSPIWEELIFRLSLFGIFDRNQYIFAIIFSIFCFAIVHYNLEDFKNINSISDFLNANHLLSYIYGGIFFSYTYLLFNYNLFFPIFFHSYLNFISISMNF